MTTASDESVTYFTYADGRCSTITRIGTRIIVVQAGTVISDETHPDLPTALAEYANWRCDPAADTPMRGDRIVVTNLRDGHLTLVVTDTDTDTDTSLDTDRRIFSIRGLRVDAAGNPGRPVAVSVSRNEVHFVSRPAPVSVSVTTPPVSAQPVSTAAVSTGNVSTGGTAPVPCPPRFRPVTWSDHLTRRARRVAVRPSAPRPLSTTKSYEKVEYAVRFEAGPGDWRVATEGRWSVTRVTQEMLDGFVEHLAARHRRDAEQIRVTATFVADDGTCLLAATSADPVRRRQRAAGDRYQRGASARRVALARTSGDR